PAPGGRVRGGGPGGGRGGRLAPPAPAAAVQAGAAARRGGAPDAARFAGAVRPARAAGVRGVSGAVRAHLPRSGEIKPGPPVATGGPGCTSHQYSYPMWNVMRPSASLRMLVMYTGNPPPLSD